RQVELGYGDIELPFVEIDAPPFEMTAEWTLEHLAGYLGTWSAVQRYIADRGDDPVSAVMPDLAAAWGEPEAPRRVAWPLDLRAGRTTGG
ncbi:MAG: SAM-dependent methyltransferase, partial [Xanthomonadales bacterium]|nr:SAM-dependent methyltransferase [Xanthomonadales bacterium]